jgi:trk system potassium uptake protein TrkH
VVLHVVAFLIICGGLSPAVVIAAPLVIAGRWRLVSLEMKLALATTLVLLVGGFGFIAAAEWNASLAHLSFIDRFHNAWFQAVTLRTAGFNSIDFALLHPATISFMMPMMFIGGSPGGTAGGVKTTTVAVLALSAVEIVRGKRVIDVFGRRLSERTQKRTLAVMTLASTTLLIAIVFMQLTQRIAPGQSAFEVVSALGTVGLSLGATAQLDGFGKLLIAACMFVGRVGGLTFFMFLSQRDRRVSADLPEADVPVG